MMNKYITDKILITCLIVFSEACSAENFIDNTINCDQEYAEISKQLDDNSKKIDNIIKVNNDIEIVISKLLPSCIAHSGLKVLIADIKISQGKNSEALNFIDKALQIDPKNARAIHTKGFILSLLGKSDMSLDMMKKALKLEPDNIDYLVNYCSTLELFLKFKDAIKICSRAAKHIKAPSVVYYIRARSYESLGQKKKAQDDYDMAKRLGFSLQPNK